MGRGRNLEELIKETETELQNILWKKLGME